MKCPKCGYNSFDHLESCKKCGGDLTDHKSNFGLRNLFFRIGKPEQATTVAAVEETGTKALPVETITPAETADFGFDFTGAGEPDEDPLESSPGELLGGDRRQKSKRAASESAVIYRPAEESDDSGVGDAHFDFAGDEEAQTRTEKMQGESPSAADLFSWDDASEEPAEVWQESPGSPEPNLAELFLESLDDSAGSMEAAPPLFADEDPFGNISCELPLPEIDSRTLAEYGEKTGAGGPSEYLWGQEREDAPPSPEEHESPPLSYRIGAGAIDLLILAMVFVLFLAAGEVALGPDQVRGFFPSLPSLLQLATPYFLVLFTVCFGYFTLFHFLLGQTPGKMLFRIRVVGEEGGGLMFSQAFLRTVGGLLSLIAAGLGYLRIVFDRERRGWNDRLANSRVIHQAGWENLEDLREVGLAEEE